MKMLQKILSHGLLIAVIVAAFFIYTNRAELLPDWFGKAETTQTARNDERAPAQPVEPGVTTAATSAGGVTNLTADKAAAVSVEPEVSAAGQVAIEPAAVSAPEPEAVSTYRPLDSAQQDASATGIRAADTPEAVAAPRYRPLPSEEVDKNVAAAGQADAGVSETPAEPVQPAEQSVDPKLTDQEPVPSEQPAAPEISAVAAVNPSSDKPAGKTVQQQLEEARQLYWQKDVSAATEAYEALGRDYPRDADIWGEIGNFYYSIQQSEPAGIAYYRTVSLLIDKGDTQKARQLLGVLYELDANRGRELDARLQQSAN